MTLDTNILIVQPYATKAVHDFINSTLLCCPDAVPGDSAYWEQYYPERRYFMNAPQGLDAWFIGYTMGDGPVKARRFVKEVKGEDGEWHEVYEDVAEGSMMLSFDTAYGYSKAGAGCSDLHAYFIYRLAQQFGGCWFQNEFTGEWFHLNDAGLLSAITGQFTALEKFGSVEAGRLAVEQTRRERAALAHE